MDLLAHPSLVGFYESAAGRAEEMDIPLQGFGSWTLKLKKEDRGVEPDECYIIGRRRASAPDLALEVIWSWVGLDKLEIYRKLKVREVHIWEEGRISVYVLRSGRYHRASRSELLPALDLSLIERHLETRWQDQAVKALRRALRQRKKAH
jgi:Uma2 family endonuclease